MGTSFEAVANASLRDQLRFSLSSTNLVTRFLHTARLSQTSQTQSSNSSYQPIQDALEKQPNEFSPLVNQH
jgi:hypothetical protein